ncbi:MAG: hypothetical protein AABY04_03040 [Candidatus Micrarchaeota archaeon]
MIATLIGGCALLALVVAGLAQTVGAIRVRDRLIGVVGVCVVALLVVGLVGRALGSVASTVDAESLGPAEGLVVAIVALGHGVLVAEIVRRRRQGPERAREIERVRGRRRERMPPRLQEPP